MPTQEQNALLRYESLKLIIQTAKKIHFEMLCAEMFDRFGILDRTVSRYLKVAKLKKYVKTEGEMILWNKNRKSSNQTS